MLILYRERDLDEAYRIDCKARTKGNEPWITRETLETSMKLY